MGTIPRVSIEDDFNTMKRYTALLMNHTDCMDSSEREFTLRMHNVERRNIQLKDIKDYNTRFESMIERYVFPRRLSILKCLLKGCSK